MAIVTTPQAPDHLADGDIWRKTGTNELRVRSNGGWRPPTEEERFMALETPPTVEQVNVPADGPPLTAEEIEQLGQNREEKAGG